MQEALLQGGRSRIKELSLVSQEGLVHPPEPFAQPGCIGALADEHTNHTHATKSSPQRMAHKSNRERYLKL